MHSKRSWFARVGVLLLVAGCSLFEPQSKVRSGDLFTTGQAQYDDYFGKVHTLQEAAAGWADEKKAARRALIDSLKIATDSVDVTILEATHERMVGIAATVGATRLDMKDDSGKVVLASESRADGPTRDFVKALQAMVDGETKLDRELRDVPQRCDDLAKAGKALEPRVHDDFFRQGGTMMADVHDELLASYDVLGQISKSARQTRRETSDFIAELGRAVDSGSHEFARPSEPPHAHPASHHAHAATPTTPPIATTTPKPKPKPKPKPHGGGGGEVFNP
jgi:hypothetical protein